MKTCSTLTEYTIHKMSRYWQLIVKKLIERFARREFSRWSLENESINDKRYIQTVLPMTFKHGKQTSGNDWTFS